MLCKVMYLAEGSIPHASKVKDSAALILGEEGMNVLAVKKGPKALNGDVVFPTFELACDADATASLGDAVEMIRGSLHERVLCLREMTEQEEYKDINQILLFVRVNLTGVPTMTVAGDPPEGTPFVPNGAKWFLNVGIGALQVEQPIGESIFAFENPVEEHFEGDDQPAMNGMQYTEDARYYLGL